MSGIYIRGMDMPKTCKECIFSRYILGEWFCRTTTTLGDDGTELWESVGKNGNFKRADFCLLVPVPPHGRLGDLDRIESNLRIMAKYQSGYRQQGILGCCETIHLTPTIIPASEEVEE